MCFCINLVYRLLIQHNMSSPHLIFISCPVGSLIFSVENLLSSPTPENFRQFDVFFAELSSLHRWTEGCAFNSAEGCAFNQACKFFILKYNNQQLFFTIFFYLLNALKTFSIDCMPLREIFLMYSKRIFY